MAINAQAAASPDVPIQTDATLLITDGRPGDILGRKRLFGIGVARTDTSMRPASRGPQVQGVEVSA